MRHFIGFMLISAVSCASCASTPTGKDTFDALQEHVWSLPTDDPAAKLYVTELGSGSPVVVLHGGPGNDFNYLVPALRPLSEKYRFVLFDQRGSLLSPVPCDRVKSLTLDVLVDDLERLRVALKQERLVLFGHSFGTMLALRYAQRHPERVGALVLAASMPPRTTAQKPFLAWIHAAHALLGELRGRPGVTRELEAAEAAGDPKALTPQAASRAFRIRFASFNVVHVERWHELQGGGVYYNEAVDEAVGDTVPAVYDGLSGLVPLGVPVTVLQGDRDYLDPSAKSWPSGAEKPPALAVRVLVGAGHYSWIDAPEAFQTAMTYGLSRAFPR